MKKNYKIEIPEYKKGELYKKSMENIRIEQLKKKADIEAEFEYNKQFIGSPTENHPSYLKELSQKFFHYKKNKDIEYLC